MRYNEEVYSQVYRLPAHLLLDEQHPTRPEIGVKASASHGRPDDLHHLRHFKEASRTKLPRKRRRKTPYVSAMVRSTKRREGIRKGTSNGCKRRSLCNNNNCPFCNSQNIKDPNSTTFPDQLSRAPVIPIQTKLVRARSMLPVLRSIPSRRAIPQPILQKAIAGPPLEDPIEIGIVRDGIACLVC